MPRLTIEDLKKIREQAVRTVQLRSGVARARITVHMGTCGISAGARELTRVLLERIESQGITDVMIVTSGCAGLCSREPMATVELKGQAPVKYVDLTPARMIKVLEQHVLEGKPVTEFALASGCETTG